jgi:hypothetical protein
MDRNSEEGEGEGVTQVVARALAKQVQCSELKLQYYQKKFK